MRTETEIKERIIGIKNILNDTSFGLNNKEILKGKLEVLSWVLNKKGDD